MSNDLIQAAEHEILGWGSVLILLVITAIWLLIAKKGRNESKAHDV